MKRSTVYLVLMRRPTLVCFINHCSGPVNIVVRTNDTDCLVISLGCFKALKEVNSELFLWLEVGLDSKNNRRYISINQLFETLGGSLALALPAFHAFSGCDYLAAFSRKGKVRPFKLLENDRDFQIAFANRRNETPELDEKDVKQIEKFVCKMLGVIKAVFLNINIEMP